MNNKLSINKLKELISAPANLDIAINYFLDILDANLLPSIPIKDIETVEIQTLLNSIVNIVSRDFELETKIAHVMLLQSINKQIYHGVCFLSEISNPVNIVYIAELYTAVIFILDNNVTKIWRLSFYKQQLNDKITYH